MSKDNNRNKLKYVIVSPRNNGGGAIVLHALCKYLNDLGYEAEMFYSGYFSKPGSFFFWYKWIMFTVKDLWKLASAPLLAKMFKRYYFNYIDVPIRGLPRKYLPWVDNNTIVVYPEIDKGNFLNAKNVVRWLLYQHTYKDGEYDKEKDLFVCYRHVFNDSKLNPKEITLYCPYFNLDLYKRTNFGERSGACYIVRQGRNRSDLPAKFDGIVIDDLFEQEKVEVFNKCKYCISYDTETAYSDIAALCGCISIVVPEPGKTITDYRNEYDKRYGIAVGFDDKEINYAKDTVELLHKELKKLNKTSRNSVSDFAMYCNSIFYDTVVENNMK